MKKKHLLLNLRTTSLEVVKIMETQTPNPTPTPKQTFVNASALSQRILEPISYPDLHLKYYKCHRHL